MLKRVGFALALSLVSLLLACGGSSSGGGGITGLIVTPATVNIPEGGTQQFSVANSNGAPPGGVNWQVNRITGGNAAVGTISNTGFYTAPQTIPNPASVTVTAVLVSNMNQTGSAIATITSVALGNASLKGNYVLSLSGVDFSNNPFYEVAAITADGAGNITNGEQDLNGPGIGYSSAAGITGTYSIGTDGRGVLQLNSNLGSFVYAIAIRALNNATVNEIDSNFQNAYGDLDLQNNSSPIPVPNGAYGFQYRGFSSTSFAAAGQFTSGATTLTGTQDLNSNGTISQAVAMNGGLNGSSGSGPGPDGLGRGTGTFTSNNRCSALVYYVVSTQRFRFLCADTRNTMLGIADAQSNVVTGNSALNGGYVLTSSALTSAGKSYTAMQFSTGGTGAINGGTYDVNDTGNVISGATVGGAYSVDTTGRITGSFTAGGTTLPFAMYAGAPGEFYYLDERTTAIGLGTAYAQSSSVAADNSSWAGSFAFNQNGYFFSAGLSAESGQVSADGKGTLAGTLDYNNPSGVVQGVTLKGSYSVGASGRTTASITTNLLGTQSYVMYVVSPTQVVFIEGDNNLIAGGKAIGQF